MSTIHRPRRGARRLPVDPAALPGFAALRGRHYFTDQEYTREELLGLLDRPSSSRRSTGDGRSRRTSKAARWR